MNKGNLILTAIFAVIILVFGLPELKKENGKIQITQTHPKKQLVQEQDAIYKYMFNADSTLTFVFKNSQNFLEEVGPYQTNKLAFWSTPFPIQNKWGQALEFEAVAEKHNLPRKEIKTNLVSFSKLCTVAHGYHLNEATLVFVEPSGKFWHTDYDLKSQKVLRTAMN